MLFMKSLTFLAPLILSVANYAQSAAAPVDPPNSPIHDVSFCQLAKAPSEFAGKLIRIRGIYRYVLEESDFEQPECCPEQVLERFRVVINENPMYPDAHSERLARKLTARMSGIALVVFVGALHGDVLGVDRVERIERLSHPKDSDHDPLWVPRHCELRFSRFEQIIGNSEVILELPAKSSFRQVRFVNARFQGTSLVSF